MKISEVCKKTGLTKRAIRFYTEKGLLSPETYEKGSREYYEYSEDDVKLLKAVSTLRKLDISLDDISKIIKEPENIPEIVKYYKEQSRSRYEETSRIQNIFTNISADECTDIYSFAECVEKVGQIAKLPPRDIEPDFSKFDEMTEMEKQEAYMQSHDYLVIENYRSRKRKIFRRLLIIPLLLLLFYLLLIMYNCRIVSFEYSGTGYICTNDGRIVAEAEITISGKTYMNWNRFRLVDGYEYDRYAVGSVTIKTDDNELIYELTPTNNEASLSSGPHIWIDFYDTPWSDYEIDFNDIDNLDYYQRNYFSIHINKPDNKVEVDITDYNCNYYYLMSPESFYHERYD